jgi:hypothetical protein
MSPLQQVQCLKGRVELQLIRSFSVGVTWMKSYYYEGLLREIMIQNEWLWIERQYWCLSRCVILQDLWMWRTQSENSSSAQSVRQCDLSRSCASSKNRDLVCQICMTWLAPCLTFVLSVYPSTSYCAHGIWQSTSIRDGMPSCTYN